MDFFEASEKAIHFFHLYEQTKILCLLRTQGALALPLESDKARERQGTLSSYAFMSITQFIRLLQGRT
jgi:hypothetical protein